MNSLIWFQKISSSDWIQRRQSSKKEWNSLSDLDQGNLIDVNYVRFLLQRFLFSAWSLLLIERFLNLTHLSKIRTISKTSDTFHHRLFCACSWWQIHDFLRWNLLPMIIEWVSRKKKNGEILEIFNCHGRRSMNWLFLYRKFHFQTFRSNAKNDCFHIWKRKRIRSIETQPLTRVLIHGESELKTQNTFLLII